MLSKPGCCFYPIRMKVRIMGRTRWIKAPKVGVLHWFSHFLCINQEEKPREVIAEEPLKKGYIRMRRFSL